MLYCIYVISYYIYIIISYVYKIHILLTLRYSTYYFIIIIVVLYMIYGYACITYI